MVKSMEERSGRVKVRLFSTANRRTKYKKTRKKKKDNHPQ